MKKLLLISVATIISVAFYSFTVDSNINILKVIPEGEQYSVPADVQAIIDKSCYGCHNTEGKTMGKMKLKFDEMKDIKVTKQINKLEKIVKVMEKGKMPPGKFAENYPDKVPSQEETEQLINWAEQMVVALGKE